MAGMIKANKYIDERASLGLKDVDSMATVIYVMEVLRYSPRFNSLSFRFGKQDPDQISVPARACTFRWFLPTVARLKWRTKTHKDTDNFVRYSMHP
jgi:hypothetical protein